MKLKSFFIYLLSALGLRKVSCKEADFRFYKEETGSWYADLPGYPGPKGDLLMVAGADTMLDVLSGGGNEVILSASLEPFENADKLELIRLVGGGGDYILKTFEGKTINHDIWLCNVIKYVFDKVPESIYFRNKSPIEQ